MNPAENLVLGTAQLGMPYGVANRIGQPDEKQALEIVRSAWMGGIRLFDTAQAYGESESVLGRTLTTLGVSQQARVISKLAPDLNLRDVGEIRGSVEASLQRLGISALEGLMLHREESLEAWSSGLKDAMSTLRAEGLIRSAGVSFYTPRRAMQALDNQDIDILQIPASVLDHRFAQAGVFNKAKAKNVKVFIRSAFLQGLLLMRPENIPANLAMAKASVSRFHAMASAFNLSHPIAALTYLRSAYPRSYILFGAETPEQVTANLAMIQGVCPPDLAQAFEDEFKTIDEPWLNPASWNNK